MYDDRNTGFRDGVMSMASLGVVTGYVVYMQREDKYSKLFGIFYNIDAANSFVDEFPRTQDDVKITMLEVMDFCNLATMKGSNEHG